MKASVKSGAFIFAWAFGTSSLAISELYAFVRTEVPATAKAVFLGGNGFRAIGMIAALDEELGRPVLSGNQVAFWHALRQAGVHAPVNGYGRVFGILNSEGR